VEELASGFLKDEICLWGDSLKTQLTGKILYFLNGSLLGITFFLMGCFFFTCVFGGIVPGQLLDWERFAAESEFSTSAKELLFGSHSQVPLHQVWVGFAVFIGRGETKRPVQCSEYHDVSYR
jgi:hypothetical protein